MSKSIGSTHTLSDQARSLLLEHSLFLIDKEGNSTIEKNDDLIVLNFILGSWCPMCLKHVKSLNESVLNLKNRNSAKNIVVTTEPERSLRDSLCRVRGNSQLSQLYFLPDASKTLLNEFGLRIPVFGLAKPATVIVQGLNSFVILSQGIPNSEKTMCNITRYLAA